MKRKRTETKSSSHLIPNDLYFDVLSRLPVQSLCRFRCVSKLWKSIISDRRFVKVHLDHSIWRCNSDAGNVMTVMANKFYRLNVLTGLENKLNGLAVANPTTREVYNLPIIEPPSSSLSYTYRIKKSYFGYDPINDQQKILTTLVFRSIDPICNGIIVQNHVFVIGGDSDRRLSDNVLRCSPRSNGLCINGTVYYKVRNIMFPLVDIVVAFDVISETLTSIPMPNWDSEDSVVRILLQFGKRLAIVNYNYLYRKKNIDMWILDESTKTYWIHKRIVFPSIFDDIIKEYQYLHIAAILHNGDILMAVEKTDKPFDLFHWSLKHASVTKVDASCLQLFEWASTGYFVIPELLFI